MSTIQQHLTEIFESTLVRLSCLGLALGGVPFYFLSMAAAQLVR